MDLSMDDAGESMSRDLADLSIGNPSPGPHLDVFEEPPPPMITSEGIVTVNVTQRFLSAAATLEPGELVKDGYFTLFESVGALEIMDPKMDSGCLDPGESLDEDYDVTRPLLPGEVVGIIDQLLSLEMAWHLGYPLSQTLFTSVYIEKMLHPDPATIQEADFIRNRATDVPRDPMLGALRAYCLGLLKSCQYVNERIKQEHYYEEEDFVTNTYHRSLLEDLNQHEIRDEIEEARKMIHGVRADLTDDMADALGLRLELRAAFLRAIELSELRAQPDSLSLPWQQMQDIWKAIGKTRHLGKPVPEAFSTKIQRRLASTMPPRPIVQPSAEETYERFGKLIADGIDVHNVLKYSDPQSLLNFVLAFQSQKPQPLVFLRTLLQSHLFRDMVILGRLSIRQLLDDDLALLVLPGSILLDPANDAVEAPQHPRYAIAEQMELFRQRAAQAYLDIFRVFCQNRCRVRRTLSHSLRNWEALQMDAEEIDSMLQLHTEEEPVAYPPGPDVVPSHSLPLSSWAYHYKLRLMEWTVQLGFELDIYQPDELGGMYWYLSHLSKLRAQHAERIQFFNARRRRRLLGRDRDGPVAGGGGTTGTGPAAEQQHARSRSLVRLAALEAAVTCELADALSRLYAALRRLGLMAPRPGSRPGLRPYGSDALRYEVRMRPFAAVGLPELPSFEAFSRAAERPGTPTAALLDGAAAAAAGARAGLEALGRLGEADAFAVGSHGRWVRGVRGWTKAAVAAGVAVGTVKRAVERGEQARLAVELPPPEKGYHEWWIVPRVVERKAD